ncbi:MAG: hypothetical protein NDJ94_19340 [Vicinamibacteria bacterium]|nr:hypothetical protein [Vicinamibacteria bacterium]
MNQLIKHPAATPTAVRAATAPADRLAAAAFPAPGQTRFGTAIRARKAIVHNVTERHQYHGTFLAVNKSAVLTLRIVREEQAQPMSIRAF